MRRFVLVPAVLLVTLPACTVSKVDPNARVVVRGSALDSSGRPLPKSDVVLAKQLGPAEVFAGAAAIAASAGLVCRGDDRPAVCRGARHARTGADGSYRFDMKGSDTQGLLRSASGFDLSVGTSAGPATSLGFLVQTEDLELPEVRLWQQRPTFRHRTGNAEADWAPLPTGAGFARATSYLVSYADEAGAPVWSGTAAAVDSRVLENTSGRLTVIAQGRGRATGTDVDFAYRSAPAAYQGVQTPPVSRGKPCAFGVATAPPQELPAAPCEMTDGDFTRPVTGAGTVLDVDLGAPTRIDLVVLRGCKACDVLIAGPDDKAFRLFTTARDGIADTTHVPVARWLRVAGEHVGADLTEVSVWSGPAEPMAPPVLSPPAAAPAAPAAPAPSRHSPLLIGLAIAALLAVAGGAAVLVRQRAKRVASSAGGTVSS